MQENIGPQCDVRTERSEALTRSLGPNIFQHGSSVTVLIKDFVICQNCFKILFALL